MPSTTHTLWLCLLTSSGGEISPGQDRLNSLHLPVPALTLCRKRASTLSTVACGGPPVPRASLRGSTSPGHQPRPSHLGWSPPQHPGPGWPLGLQHCVVSAGGAISHCLLLDPVPLWAWPKVLPATVNLPAPLRSCQLQPITVPWDLGRQGQDLSCLPASPSELGFP